MHNLVKEATGIDFSKFGDDVTSAKEVAWQTLKDGGDNQNKNAIESCPSVGHVLNEVDKPNLVFNNIISSARSNLTMVDSANDLLTFVFTLHDTVDIVLSRYLN